MSGDKMGYVSLNCPCCGTPLTAVAETITCPACGSKLIFRRSTLKERAETGERQPVGSMRSQLIPFRYSDPQAGMDVFQMLIPEGWQTMGGVQWINNRLNPAPIHFAVYNPGGFEAVEFFPVLHFGFSDNPGYQGRIQPGGDFMGTEFYPPQDVSGALQFIIFQRFRPIQGIQILDCNPDADLGQRAMAGFVPSQNEQAWAEGFQARLRYNLQNQPVLEQMSGAILYRHIQTRTMMSSFQTFFWTITGLSGYRAVEEQFETWKPTLHKVVTSVEVNPQWIANLRQVVSQMGQQALGRVQQLGQTAIRYGQQVAAMSDQRWEAYQQQSQAADASFDRWQQQENSRDRMQNQWTDYIRGTQEYYDPYKDQNVELDSSYKHVWSNPNGEYILTDDILLDPNIGSTTPWEKLEPDE